MKKFISILLLLASSLGFFTSAFAIQYFENPDINLTFPAPVKIIVSEAVPAAIIIASSDFYQTSQKFSCAGGQYLKKTLIQDRALVNPVRAITDITKAFFAQSVSFPQIGFPSTASNGVNLNQPADCFSLSPAELIQNQTTLSVEPLVEFQQRIVVLPTARIAKDFLRIPKGAQQTGTEAIPVGLVLITPGLTLFSITILLKLKKFANPVRTSLNLAQLQIMRC